MDMATTTHKEQAMITTTTTTYELKNVKIAEWASEETTCFDATLYMNGKRIGTCGNDGHGGCNRYDFNTTTIIEDCEEWLWNDHVVMCEQYGLDQKPRNEFCGDLDSLINALIDQHYIAKDAKAYAKSISKKYALSNDQHLCIYTDGTTMFACIEGSDQQAKILAEHPNAIIAPTSAALTI
jgi:hypothetical protein